MSAHKYELMFIADPELDERGLKKLTEQYLETVTKEGGAVENIDFLVLFYQILIIVLQRCKRNLKRN